MSGSRSSAARATLGLPDNFKVFSAFPLKGMNQSASRIAMDDSEAFWIENFIKIGDGNFRTTWDVGTPLFTSSSGSEIIYFFFYNIGLQPYVAVFFADGRAVQVAYPTGTITVISGTAGTFYNQTNNQLPVCVQSGTQYLLISNNNTENDYWIWDGSLLYYAGGIAPFNSSQLLDGGVGYTGVPSYTIYGGHGGGISLTPVINNGSVIGLEITNPGFGYLPGDVVQVAFSGGGSDTTPILTSAITPAAVQYISLLAGGMGYFTGTFPLGFTGGGGSGAAGTYTVVGGVVTSIVLTAGGSGYTDIPTISFPFSGTPGSITASLTATSVSSLTIVSAGSGYVAGTYNLGFSGGGGSGAQATYTVNGTGTIVSTTIITGGIGYTSPPTVEILTGSGAIAEAGLVAGSVSGVAIFNGGTNLHGTPTLSFRGGGGTGAAATAVVTSGAITSVTITNAGSGYTSAPAVIVQSAVNNAAVGTLSLMPYGISGTSMETYQGRVWISYPNQTGPNSTGGVFYVSAPQSLTDFATSAGGDIFTNTDRFLRQQYTFLRQTSNFLYATGDSSVSVISNVQTSGNPSTTTFSYQNSDPQIGTIWRDTAQDYGNTILFSNVLGVFGIYGGSIRKVSKKMDRVFTNLVPPAKGGLTPTSAMANIYTQKVYLLLCTVTDPFTFNRRNLMLVWDGDDWTVATQTPALTYIGTQEYQSNLKAWGTDGTHLYPLFNTPSTIASVFSTKLWGGAQSFMINMTHSVYIDAEDVSATQAGIQWYGTVDADGLAVPVQNYVTGQVASCPSGSYPFAQTLQMIAPKGSGAMYGFGVGAGMPQVPGVGLGLTLATSSLDLILRNVSLGYIETTAVA